jgi:hypothetical protein
MRDNILFMSPKLESTIFKRTVKMKTNLRIFSPISVASANAFVPELSGICLGTGFYIT